MSNQKQGASSPQIKRVKFRSIISFLIVFLCNKWESGYWIKVSSELKDSTLKASFSYKSVVFPTGGEQEKKGAGVAGEKKRTGRASKLNSEIPTAYLKLLSGAVRKIPMKS